MRPLSRGSEMGTSGPTKRLSRRAGESCVVESAAASPDTGIRDPMSSNVQSNVSLVSVASGKHGQGERRCISIGSSRVSVTPCVTGQETHLKCSILSSTWPHLQRSVSRFCFTLLITLSDNVLSLNPPHSGKESAKGVRGECDRISTLMEWGSHGSRTSQL